MRFFVLLISIALLGSPALSQTSPSIDPYSAPDPDLETPLDGDDLTALFLDQTHRGYYQADWENAGPAFTERMNVDGTTIHVRDGVTTSGTWQTRENVVCFTYEDFNGGCFNMYQRGNCFYAVSAFTNDLVAVTVIGDETPDCEPSYA